MTADLLCRQIMTIPIESIQGLSDIYPLLTARSKSVQRTAYEILHRFIPKDQEQVSFDVALSKTTVKLPDELLSLLHNTPTIESISDSDNEEKWTDLRSYLLSWKIGFDHFSQAVSKIVRCDLC
jgi:E3 ubiquitin-protein ligase listerin